MHFLVIPEQNTTQSLQQATYTNSKEVSPQFSVNGLGFPTLRYHMKNVAGEVVVRATFVVSKKVVNPFSFDPAAEKDRSVLGELGFRVDHARFLQSDHFSHVPDKFVNRFPFSASQSIFENLKSLNTWCFEFLEYNSTATDTGTTVAHLMDLPHGVCQDYSHLFCGFARLHQIPARYVSGYLNQGANLEGAAQMHAWVEALVPGIGWLGFDPTNNILVNENHIKVCHGRNYADCAPLKGVVLGVGQNTTRHQVEVSSQQ